MFDEIQSDPDICSNCFQRTHHRYERNYRLEVVQRENEEGKKEWTVEPVQVSAVELTMPNGDIVELGGMPDDLYRVDGATMRITEQGAHRGIRTVCNCGYRWAPKDEVEEWKNRPLDKRTFFEYAKNLHRRLRESDVSMDDQAFVDKLDEMKSNPDAQFADDSIYAKAIDFAIESELVSASD